MLFWGSFIQRKYIELSRVTLYGDYYESFYDGNSIVKSSSKLQA